ncbi:MAG: aldo/keto reductase [Candidatus Hydrogenedentes bacterium]|nr:aldo/keto reductase [Candidatus Hydrogenedentota bacterium]
MAHLDNLHLDRRSFLKAGALGAAGILGAPALASAAEEKPVPRPGYRILGRTGLEVSVVSLGAFQVKETAIMQAAFEHGANLVDTGRMYLDGRNEQQVGEAVRGYGGKIYVVTKLVDGEPKEAMEKSVNDSLDALKMDCVDVLMLHNTEDPKEIQDGPSREVIIKAREQGKTRFLGVSTHKNEAGILNAVVDDPDKLFDCVLLTYSYKSPPEVKEALARAAKAGIGVIAMKTQMGGYSGKEFGGITPHQAALKWVLNDENIACAIPSMCSLEQIKEDMAVVKMFAEGQGAVTPGDSAALERYGDAIASRWCYRCGACAPTCPLGADIPVLNRCLMYAEGYGDLELARAARQREMPSFPCACCSGCVARCPRGVNLPANTARARRVLA